MLAFRHMLTDFSPCLIMVLFLLFPVGGSVAAQAAADYLFGDSVVYEYRLYFSQPDFWDSLRFNFEVLDEEYLPCDLVFEDSTYSNIGVRFKGNSSYALYPGVKKSFKLDFNKYVDDLRFFGLKKLNLNNGFLDPTQIREKLFLDILERYVPCIRGAYARLYINDEYWGLYTVVEQPDDTFLEDRFGPDDAGNLFKGDPSGDLAWYGADADDYYERYELKTNELENDWSDLIHLIDVLNHTSADSLRTALSEVIDVRNYLTVHALNNIFVNLDSYYGSGHNYYLYHQDAPDRFIYLPWDVNEAFGTFNFNLPPDGIISHDLLWVGITPTARPLTSRVLNDDYWAELYLNLVEHLLQNEFTASNLYSRIDFYRALIAPSVGNDPNRMFTFSEFQTNITSEVTWGVRHIPGLKDFISSRRSSIGDQVAAHPQTDRVKINEFMAANESTVADAQGEFEDWIELYNDNLYPVSLSGYYLTDDFSELNKWVLPNISIAAGGHLLIWADNDTGDGSLHANFKLGASGEQIALVDASMTVVDSLTFGQQADDVAYGRFPDGTGSFIPLAEPTPGEANRLPVNQPPEISGTAHTPRPAFNADPVMVLSFVRDESSLSQVYLYYNAGDGYVDLAMHDDGLHGDSSAADNLYGVTIPPFSDSTVIAFYVAAVDDSGAVSFDPPDTSAPFRYQVGEVPPKLFINEFMADNDNIVSDLQGDFDDWIELYNGGSGAVNTGGMYLTDNHSRPARFVLPDTTIPAGGYLLVWADGDTLDGPLHASFSLKASGEQIGLFSARLTAVDSLTFGPQATDVSYGRAPDGDSAWTVFASPSPESRNSLLTCCTGSSVGDCDCNGRVDIADLSALIDHMFLSFQPLCCDAEANINHPSSGAPVSDEIVDITDLQMMAELLFILLQPFPPCP